MIMGKRRRKAPLSRGAFAGSDNQRPEPAGHGGFHLAFNLGCDLGLGKVTGGNGSLVDRSDHQLRK